LPTVVCNGVTVNYHDVGSGDTVVLIHCSSSSLRQWRSLWELLQNKYRIIAIDMLDWGETDAWIKTCENLLIDETNLIKEVISGIDESIHLVGHSYGGTIAYHLAMTSPTKIKSLTLIEPMLGWLLDPKKEAKYHSELRRVAEYFWEKYSIGKAKEGIEYYFDYWNGEGAWRNLDKGLSDYVLAGAEKNFHEFEAIFEGGKALSKPEYFKQPVLLIGGAESQQPPLRILELLEGMFPNSRSHLIEGATHMSPITHSDHVNLIIRNFLST
jgi:pimeloyl-ACP methyl ester carboxylesterase